MKKIQQVSIHGPDDVRLEAAVMPVPGPRDVVVRAMACGICGSDVGYARLGGVIGPTLKPMPIGHEVSGVVESVGMDVRGIEAGVRVVINPLGAGNQIGNGGSEGAFTSHVLVRNAASGECLIPIPDSLSFESAALAEPLGVGMQAVNRAAVAPSDRVVVFGAGPIGLAAIATMKSRGIEDVIAVDLSETRLEIARSMGARETLNPSNDSVWRKIRELHGESPVLGAPMAGTDVYIEATGVSSIIGEVLASAKTEARLSIVGLHRGEVPINFLLVMMKQMTILGSMAQPKDWNDMIDLLNDSDLSRMITHRFSLDRFSEGLAAAQDPNAGGKVMIDLSELAPES
ncbi:MAG TPA: alcohol dehydrogenase [Myxococcales bacterium]|nr:alcohol dehydrogenase [Myxococcales bacterium]HIK86677.1 alcohol dehydrogenase [Myxococcales bacterium]